MRRMHTKDRHSGLTVERLKEALHYNPETGVFRWKIAIGYNIRVGDEAGSVQNHRYVRIWLDGNRYVAHRLAWLYVHGEWPVALIDHINNDKSDNRIINLRESTNSQNKANGPSYKTKLGLPRGVYVSGHHRFGGQIKCGGKHYHLGIFDTPERAHAAYMDAAKKLHGDYAHPGVNSVTLGEIARAHSRVITAALGFGA